MVEYRCLLSSQSVMVDYTEGSVEELGEKECIEEQVLINKDGTLAVSLVEDKMYSRKEAIENVYELLAEKLGLEELEAPKNRWVNKEGQYFTLTQSGFKRIK